MTQEEANKLSHGLYRIYWLDPQNPKYACSLAAVGSDNTGNRWMQAANWISLRAASSWNNVERVELIEAVDDAQKSVERGNLTDNGTYKVLIMDDERLRVQLLQGYILLDLQGLIGSLRECGYQIEQPPSKIFLEIKSFLDSPEQELRCTDATGNKVYCYEESSDSKARRAREVRIAEVENRVEVTIHSEGQSVFVGYILSLNEFKLIWNRII